MSEPDTNTCTHTKDGHIVYLYTAAHSMIDVEIAAKSETDGIGLLNTDFMYTNRNDLPSEEEIFETLLQIVQKMGDRPVVVRLMQLKPQQIPALQNEGLPDNCRGLRLGLARPKILETQLRAIIRASATSNLRLLLPMVADVSEIIRFKEVTNVIQNDLNKQDIQQNSLPDLGIEIEVPAAAVMASVLSFEVSFFNISERLMNNSLLAFQSKPCEQELLHNYNPSFLLQISNLALEVRKRRKSLCLTAPLASQIPAIPLLVGMGVNELIMEPEKIGIARQIISRLSMPRAKLVASKALSFWYADEIEQYAEECLARLLK